MLALHLTLAHYKAQGQGHAHFDCEYLANSASTHIENRIRPPIDIVTFDIDTLT